MKARRITYCIIDDEPIAHRIIEAYCADLNHLQKIGNAYNVFEASSLFTQQNADLIFLDINMPKMTGFEWLKTLPNPPQIIVTTAYKEFAIEGYELDIVDYLLKPFSFARFLKAVNKAIDLKETIVPITSSNENISPNRFFLKGDKKHHQIHLDEIIYIEAYGNYTKVYLADQMIVSHEKISILEKLLPQDKFLRVHKSFIVAVDKISHIQQNQIVLFDYKVSIGKTYRSRVNELLR